MPLDPSTDSSFASFLPGQQTEDDRMLLPRFFLGKKLLGAESHKAGREIYADREMIEIKIKGQDKQVVVEEVKLSHRQRFPIQYAAFKNSQPVPVVGTPVEQLPGVGPSLAHRLKGMNIHTIEDVAMISDENTISAMGMGSRDLIRRAKAWVEQKAPDQMKLEEENRALREENDRLKARQDEQARQIASIQEAMARRPGRKRKEQPGAPQ